MQLPEFDCRDFENPGAPGNPSIKPGNPSVDPGNPSISQGTPASSDLYGRVCRPRSQRGMYTLVSKRTA
eukprot:3938010-Pyramimonas_sp.AAC.1